MRINSGVWVLVLAAGCGGPVEFDRGEGQGITVCMNGAGGDRHPGNQVIAALCEGLPGLLSPCSDGECRPDHRFTDTESARRALTQTILDIRANEEVKGPVSLVGYSFGGINIVEQLLPVFLQDEDLDVDDRYIDRLVLIDPFRPWIADPLEVPRGVKNAWNYRHSVAPEDDCSARPPQRGYQGVRIRCQRTSRCRDYDFSTTEPEIDHCDITDRSAPAVLDNVLRGIDHSAADFPVGRDATSDTPVTGQNR